MRQIYELLFTLTKIKARIAAFIGKPHGTYSSESNSGQEAPVSGDSGNYSGGCASKSTKTLLACPLALVLFGLIVFITFYLLTLLGGNNPTREEIMNTSQIKQVVYSV